MVIWPAAGAKGTEQLVTSTDPEFEQFFLANYDGLVRSLTAITGDSEVARDCVQEAFIKASTRWRKVGRLDNPVAWIRRVAINRSRDIYRSDERRRRREGLSSPEVLAYTEDTSSDVDGSMRLVELLQTLPPKQKSAAALYYVDDLPIAEVAEVLGVSTGTVKFHLNQAREHLRQALERESQDYGY